MHPVFPQLLALKDVKIRVVAVGQPRGLLTTVVIAGYLMPTVDEVPAGFPADVLWQFRIASLGTQAVLWTSVGLLFGALTDRALRQERRAAEAPVAAAAP